MPWGWIFAQIIKDERSTKVAKIIVIHWCLTFLRRGQVCFSMHLYGHHTFVWEKCWEFQMTSPLKPLGQCCSNFMWSLLRLWEQKIAKMVGVHWPRWPPCPYRVKTFKNLLITETCLYNFDPLKPHFYTVKLGFTGVYIIFLISVQNIDCGYSLERVPTINVLSRNMKNIRIFYLKIFIFWW